MKRRTFTSLVTGLSVAAGLMGTTAMAQDDMRIALVVKALGIGFFEAAAEGANEAAAELGNVEIIYTGPTSTTAEGQIEVINSLIAQGVDAIAISANDPDVSCQPSSVPWTVASLSSAGIPAWLRKAA